MYTLSAFTAGKLEQIEDSEDAGRLLAVGLEMAWETPATLGPLYLITSDTGALHLLANVVQVFSEIDGLVEIHRPGQSPERVRITYALDAHGRYDHTTQVAA